MNRCLAVLLAVCALTGCSLAGSPERSDAAVLVGVGDQIPSTFSDPNFLKLNIKRSRFFVALERGDGQAPARLLRRSGSTAGGDGRRGAAHRVRPRRGLEVPEEALQAADDARVHEGVPGVPQALARRSRCISPWNEANHRSQPTLKNPKRAAQYYNIVRKYCRGCTIVAADVIDESNMESWLKTFKKTATKPQDLGPPQLQRHEQAQGPEASAAPSAC